MKRGLAIFRPRFESCIRGNRLVGLYRFRGPYHRFQHHATPFHSQLLTSNRCSVRHTSTSASVAADAIDSGATSSSPAADVLTACPGCGALAQTILPGEAGFYSIKRRRVKSFLGTHKLDAPRHSSEEEIYSQIYKGASQDVVEALGLSEETTSESQSEALEAPFCDRCHNLLHHQTGQSVEHPSIQSIKAIIAESPFVKNQIYHVLDAADFPLSLVRNIHRIVSAAPQRSRNRRAKNTAYIAGKVTDVTFVITRSDLLAPRKEQVDRLMPYLVRVLRDALGRSGRNVRLGNVRCVSARRGWWTKELKSDIWRKGGANWMLGKVNVGKSNLYEAIFPKGRNNENVNFDAVRTAAFKKSLANEQPSAGQQTSMQYLEAKAKRPLSTDVRKSHLLPPARSETLFPLMPIVSALPGTTASPIRIPFGGGRGELIDLPGLSRGDLEKFVPVTDRHSLMMKSSVRPEQLPIKPGQSLILGGIIRITPLSEDLVFLAHAFVPLDAHVTSTEKAIQIQADNKIQANTASTTDGVSYEVRSAGRHALSCDITKQRAGPLTARSAAGLKSQQLPFRVLAIDVLIAGVGWVELAAQIRTKNMPHSARESHDDSQVKTSLDHATLTSPARSPGYPEVEVFSPNGDFIGIRESMVASMFSSSQRNPQSERKSRPRLSMRSVKARRKKV